MSQFPTVFTPEKQSIFLDKLSDCGNVRRAADEAGVSPRLLYWHRKQSPEFAEAWQEALTEAIESVLEPEALRRAVEGVQKPVYQQGELVGHVREYSDTLLIFLLKAARPDKYRDNARKEDRQDISDLLKAVLLELADRHTLPAPAQEAEWAPLPPSERTNGQDRRALPEPPGIDEEG